LRYVVEQWAPEYGASVEPDALAESQAPVDISVELPADDWRPLGAGDRAEVPGDMAFVDGVRRVEARLWITGAPEARTSDHRPGICASYAAGAVRCNGSATVVEAAVRRSLFCDGSGLEPIQTRHGRFGVRQVTGGSLDALSLGLQAAMGELEHEVSASVPHDCLLVVDGPLRERRTMSHAVGYVKTHHVAYLPAVVRDVVVALGAGERTPVFLIGDRFRRWSWYVRLPGDRSHGWAGVVRCEASPDRSVTEVRHLADCCALALPRFASEPHKDPRAPQNLYPIAGLERELRRRLGDPGLLYRALRAAPAGEVADR
jgi:hypothetical protein